jgi:hypothetical protein
MAVTPEGKIKSMVVRTLAQFEASARDVGGFVVSDMYTFWPVPSGFGASSIDCLVCFRGVFIGIETKAPGKKPTPRQKLTIAEIEGSGGKVFVIDGEDGCKALKTFLHQLVFRTKNADHR